MARFDVSRLGRFSSPDALSGTINSPQSLNRYSSVLNDPINGADPLGLSCRKKGPDGYCPGEGPKGDGGGSCNLDGIETPCAFVGVLLNGGGLQACLNSACTIQGDLSPSLGGAQVNLTVGYVGPAYPCPWGDCRVSPPWIDIYVTVPLGWIAIPQGGLGQADNSSGGSVLDDRANALARAINKTGVQVMTNPCTYAVWYGGSAGLGFLGGAALGGEAAGAGQAVVGASAPYWPAAMRWLYIQSTLAFPVIRGLQTAARVTQNGCDAMQ